MKKVTATFKGKNHSLGYITGQTYELIIRQNIRRQEIHIHRKDNGNGQCEYSDMLKFLENWTDIKTN